jgi:catechol 2,3-dioxygenase-like lactoylglutathione lyase family enzyme
VHFEAQGLIRSSTSIARGAVAAAVWSEPGTPRRKAEEIMERSAFVRFHHVGITVADIERSVAFYDQLGFRRVTDAPITHRGPWISEMTAYPEAVLEVQHLNFGDSGPTLELVRYLSPSGIDRGNGPTHHIGSAHVCLEVLDLAREVERLERSGVTFKSPIIVVPDDHPAAAVKAIYGIDPDGNAFELLQFPSPASQPGRPKG